MPEGVVERPKKSVDFSEWYNDIVERADLIDKRYPVKGMDVWRPYGLRAMRRFDDATRREMEATRHIEVQFPLLIPRTEFQKEADHIKGFGGNVYWVTKGGDSDLDVPLLLRPTSETAMYSMFALWVRSHADLPLKTFQIVNTFRYETKQTRSFIRVREIHFFEAHTCHADFADAERQIRQDLEVAGRLFRGLAMPFIVCRRPEWDKFAGAHYSLGCDVFVPEAERVLQVASIHQYRDNFAKPYGIRYERADGGFEPAHQTTYGMSERVLGGVIALHGDDAGLVLPAAIAPHEVVIVPVIFKGKEAEVAKAVEAHRATLAAAGLRVHLDDRGITAGAKYNDWEMRGVPLRVEVGPRDVEKGQVVLVPRPRAGEKPAKRPVPAVGLADEVRKALRERDDALWKNALARFRDAFQTFAKAEEARDHKGVGVVGWCGVQECGLEIEKSSDKTVLGEPARDWLTGLETAAQEAYDEMTAAWKGVAGFRGACGACGKATDRCVLVARSF